MRERARGNFGYDLIRIHVGKVRATPRATKAFCIPRARLPSVLIPAGVVGFT